MRVIGVMSGSSLDGLDLALCSFDRSGTGMSYRIEAATTTPFPDGWTRRLLGAANASAFELAQLHRDLGRLIGERVRAFLQQHGQADLVASHGHTIFHQPDLGFTTQIGCGAQIAALTGLPSVVDFRTKDIALGGQGAPLVPLGERMLFDGFDAFVNLGGIANVSFHGNGNVTGYDVCTCNQALNALAGELGKPYDADGAIAASGTLHPALLAGLNAMPFLQRSVPRSLGRELFESDMLPLLNAKGLSVADRSRTCTEHIAQHLTQHLDRHAAKRVMVTGGGAHNRFLMDRMCSSTAAEIVVPDPLTVDYKEALIFALLGLLRWEGGTNTLRSVTGATRDSVGGAVYLPN
jgi:anhydro-N-acetylmuramic acid kinase